MATKVKIDQQNRDEGWLIPRSDVECCCADMKRAFTSLTQVHIEIILGQPAIVIRCHNTYDIIGQYCPFCGDKIVERSDNDGNHNQ